MIAFSDFKLNKTADGLLPVIIQDSITLKVLMLGYMNREAFNKSQSEGRVTFYSRSRQQLWTKGETSGNYLTIVDMHADCDMDTLLVRVIPAGPVCHMGTTSCFNTEESQGFIRKLGELIRQRHTALPDGHYTTRLFVKGTKTIAKKVSEEAAEAIIEAVDGNRNRFVYEAADVVYHMLVLMEQMGCTIADLEAELENRHR